MGNGEWGMGNYYSEKKLKIKVRGAHPTKMVGNNFDAICLSLIVNCQWQPNIQLTIDN